MVVKIRAIANIEIGIVALKKLNDFYRNSVREFIKYI